VPAEIGQNIRATARPQEIAAQRRRVWQHKYAIRACYRGWFERMRPFIVEGPSVEVGASFGPLKDYWPALRTADVVPTAGLDLVADAVRLPFGEATLGNLVVVDLLHHLADPHRFLDEAARVLRPGGRLLAIEPYLTPVSRVAYRLLHHETIRFDVYHPGPDKADPWEGNLAAANLLFVREARHWSRRHHDLAVIHKRPFSLFDFQLAGGFRPYALVGSRRLYDLVLFLDRRLDRLASLCGFRIFVVIERRAR